MVGHLIDFLIQSFPTGTERLGVSKRGSSLLEGSICCFTDLATGLSWVIFHPFNCLISLLDSRFFLNSCKHSSSFWANIHIKPFYYVNYYNSLTILFKAILNNEITSYLKGIANVSQGLFHLILTLHCDLHKAAIIIFMLANIEKKAQYLVFCIFSLLYYNVNFRRNEATDVWLAFFIISP